jgi:hypothetical protein
MLLKSITEFNVLHAVNMELFIEPTYVLQEFAARGHIAGMVVGKIHGSIAGDVVGVENSAIAEVTEERI